MKSVAGGNTFSAPDAGYCEDPTGWPSVSRLYRPVRARGWSGKLSFARHPCRDAAGRVGINHFELLVTKWKKPPIGNEVLNVEIKFLRNTSRSHYRIITAFAKSLNDRQCTSGHNTKQCGRVRQPPVAAKSVSQTSSHGCQRRKKNGIDEQKEQDCFTAT